MANKKQFHLKIKWKNREKTEAHEIVLYDGGQPICELISVQDARLLQEILNDQHKQIKQLKAQLYCKEEEICQICKHKYLLKDDVDRYENKPSYYTAHCRKGHIECSKGYVKHCKDFKLKTGDV